MIKRWVSFFLFIGLLTWVTLVYAVDINLINVDMSPDDNSRLANVYGQAYGYPPQQVMPLMSGPPQEVPAILQIAQAASQVPTTVWMMRRMGMSYNSILSTFALAPSVLAGGPGGSPYGYPQVYGPPPPPYWARWTDPFYVQTARVYFLRDTLRVPVQYIPFIPVRGIPFARSILYPYHPAYGYWMPPGIAKKYGLWIPPGQAKKMGWGPWGWYGDDWKGPKHGWKGHDWDHDWDHDWKGGKWDDHGWKNGKHHWDGDDDHQGQGNKHQQGDEGNGGHGNGHKSSGQNLVQGNDSSSKGHGNSHGGSSGKSHGGNGKGKNK